MGAERIRLRLLACGGWLEIRYVAGKVIGWIVDLSRNHANRLGKEYVARAEDGP